MLQDVREDLRSIWTPYRDGSEALSVPLWHPSYGSNPATYISKDRNAIPFTRTGGTWGKYGWTADGDDLFKYTVADWRGSDEVGTVYGWVKTSSATGQCIFGSGDEDAAIFFLVGIRDSGEIYINTNPVANDAVRGSTNVADGNFHSFALLSNGSAWSIFVDYNTDGLTVLVGSNSGVWLADVGNRDNITIGASVRNVTSAYANGTIGEVHYNPSNFSFGRYVRWRQNTQWRYRS